MNRDAVSRASSGQLTDRRQRQPGAGRRRDSTIDDRIRRAARTLYAHEGWSGLHFEGVARAARVSKDAIYRRYPDAQELLLDALSDQSFPVLSEDKPVEEALVDFACDVFNYFADGDGYSNLRVHIDGAKYPVVLERYRRGVIEPQLAQAAGVLERARKAGHVNRLLHPSAVMEALGGAVMVYALTSTSSTEMCSRSPDVVRQLNVFVHQILYGQGMAALDFGGMPLP